MKANKGSGLEAHHIIEKRFSGTLNISNTNKMLAVSISKSNHRTYTNIWRKMLPYGKEYKKRQIFFSAMRIYHNSPKLVVASIKTFLRR